MRTIKFRAWDGETMYDSVQGSGEFERFLFPPYEAMQFTGLRDVTGNEIYEGDIVKYWDDGAPDAVPVIRTVIYDTPSFWLQRKSGDRTGVDTFSTSNISEEVIGNIYENPDLLTQHNSEV